MTHVITALVTYLRKRPRRTVAALAVFVLLVVPVVPFTPHCNLDPNKKIHVNGPITPEYRTKLKYAFRSFEIYYWDIAGVILLRALPFLDGDDTMDQFNGILNAERKSAWSLANEYYDGRIINGKVYRVPEHVKKLRDPKTGHYDSAGCEFMYAVITGKPAPAEVLKMIADQQR